MQYWNKDGEYKISSPDQKANLFVRIWEDDGKYFLQVAGPETEIYTQIGEGHFVDLSTEFPFGSPNGA